MPAVKSHRIHSNTNAENLKVNHFPQKRMVDFDSYQGNLRLWIDRQ